MEYIDEKAHLMIQDWMAVATRWVLAIESIARTLYPLAKGKN